MVGMAYQDGNVSDVVGNDPRRTSNQISIDLQRVDSLLANKSISTLHLLLECVHLHP